MDAPKLLKRHRTFEGFTEYYEHVSRATGTPMRFGLYVPPQAATKRCPVVTFLAGLTCTEENFLVKAGAQAHAAKHGLILVAPDTSPRGAGIAGEDEGWDFGAGAGFYLNATVEPWLKNYRMEDYVVTELPGIIAAHFPVLADRQGIMGHSMGGHGALTLALRHPEKYRSVSAFAPIVAPSRVPWGQKAFRGYLGTDENVWADHDTTALVRRAKTKIPLLVDQGTADEWLKPQLKPELLEEACRAADYPLTLRYREGYDHSYYFIATFIGEHLDHHAQYLGGPA